MKCFLENGPLVSVVVLSGRGHKRLNQCLESVLCQTYRNLEILLVNAPTFKTDKAVRKMCHDKRIRKIVCRKCAGEHTEYLAGVRKANGKYLLFVKNTDAISADWVKILLKKAIRTESDMVVGDWCFDDGEHKEYFNLDPFRIKDFDMDGAEAWRTFKDMRNRSVSWGVIWNKLYSKGLWERSVSAQRNISSSHAGVERRKIAERLWKNAKRVTNAHGGEYYRFREAGIPADKVFFQSLTTELDVSLTDEYDRILREIVSPKTAYVSFDIFDTLIERPFIYPTDLFELVSNALNEKTSSYIDFAFIRRNGEQECRDRLKSDNPSREEITLDEIYDYIGAEYVFPKELLESMKAMELQMEKTYCRPRQIGRELYELAVDAGKRIIICSDMYLPAGFIKELLSECGYKDYGRLFLSSDKACTKESGRLFRCIKKELGIQDADCIVHIGDNRESDVKQAESEGLRAVCLRSASDLFLQNDIEHYYGNIYNRAFRDNGWIEDTGSVFHVSWSLRTLTSVAINRFLGNPFVSFNKASDFNGNPRYVGYYALGSFLLSLSEWIFEVAKRENVPTIHFVARDGWLVKKHLTY